MDSIHRYSSSRARVEERVTRPASFGNGSPSLRSFSSPGRPFIGSPRIILRKVRNENTFSIQIIHTCCVWRRGRIKGSTLNHANVNGRLMTCFRCRFLAPTKKRASCFSRSLARLIALLPVSTDEQAYGLHYHAFLAMQIVKRLCVCM